MKSAVSYGLGSEPLLEFILPVLLSYLDLVAVFFFFFFLASFILLGRTSAAKELEPLVLFAA